MTNKVTVHLARKLSDGNFGSFDLQFGVEVDVKEGEKFSEVFDRSYSLVESKLIEHALEIDDAVSANLKAKKHGSK